MKHLLLSEELEDMYVDGIATEQLSRDANAQT